MMAFQTTDSSGKKAMNLFWRIKLWIRGRRYAYENAEATMRLNLAKSLEIARMKKQLQGMDRFSVEYDRIVRGLAGEVEYWRGKGRYDVSDRLRALLASQDGKKWR